MPLTAPAPPARTATLTAPPWRGLPAAQQPPWPDPAAVADVTGELARLPALTAAADVRQVGAALADVSAHQAFLLQAGDCAEPTGAMGVAALQGKHRVLGEMGEIISNRLDVPTMTVGRIAGQYAKPRSKPEEIVGGRALPVFRGLNVNAPEADAAARIPDPRRLLAGYHSARALLSELHIIAHRAASDLTPLSAASISTRRPRSWDGTLRAVLDDYGRTHRTEEGWRRTGLWTSHEALLLDYEEPFVRRDARTGEDYLLSTHLPWVGDRTRQVDGAHIALLAHIANPVAVKIGPGISRGDLIALCHRLDPHRRPGRLTLIARLGAADVRRLLPEMIRTVAEAGHQVVWACDPMHGNTFTAATGHKTRHMDDIVAETSAFIEILHRAGQWPGGLHLEVAGDRVTECLGAGGPRSEQGLARAYRTLCDPRLNDDQARLLAQTAADLIARG
ncbi:3-deoxy-7-phosphoheptulonate synthase [Streptomyces sp. MNP-20]|uniref:3-deoxy-7-phosphoheptulonate synthase n=1 Tax=Streptomyces sp. MNP-20 TaxID=2721165 RepID=UPI0015521F8A|nr:3-deoxy-7-phosphoheptulonate synthase [Streptomyces sp. MNP-20]